MPSSMTFYRISRAQKKYYQIVFQSPTKYSSLILFSEINKALALTIIIKKKNIQNSFIHCLTQSSSKRYHSSRINKLFSVRNFHAMHFKITDDVILRILSNPTKVVKKRNMKNPVTTAIIGVFWLCLVYSKIGSEIPFPSIQHCRQQNENFLIA